MLETAGLTAATELCKLALYNVRYESATLFSTVTVSFLSLFNTVWTIRNRNEYSTVTYNLLGPLETGMNILQLLITYLFDGLMTSNCVISLATKVYFVELGLFVKIKYDDL